MIILPDPASWDLPSHINHDSDLVIAEITVLLVALVPSWAMAVALPQTAASPEASPVKLPIGTPYCFKQVVCAKSGTASFCTTAASAGGAGCICSSGGSLKCNNNLSYCSGGCQCETECIF
jgi:hypothetical protein